MKFYRSDILKFVDSKIISHKLLTEEQKENRMNQMVSNRLEDLIQKKQDAVDGFKCFHEKWIQTEQFKLDILPKLLFDYMKTNREEYIEYLLRWYKTQLN